MIGLVNPHNELIARRGRNGRNSHGPSPTLKRHAREVHCVFVRPRHACVAGRTQCQRNSASIWHDRRNCYAQATLSLKISFPAPSYGGVTNRGGGKRWTGPRPLAVPPSRPTSRPVGQLREALARVCLPFFSSQPPRQRPHHQGQPGEGPDRQYDRAVREFLRQRFHGEELAA